MMIRPRKSILGNSDFAVRSQFTTLYITYFIHIFTFRFFSSLLSDVVVAVPNTQIFSHLKEAKKKLATWTDWLILLVFGTCSIWNCCPLSMVILIHHFFVKWRWLCRSLINRFACLHAFVCWLRLRPFKIAKEVDGRFICLHWRSGWRSRLKSEDGLSCGDAEMGRLVRVFEGLIMVSLKLWDIFKWPHHLVTNFRAEPVPSPSSTCSEMRSPPYGEFEYQWPGLPFNFHPLKLIHIGYSLKEKFFQQFSIISIRKRF